MLPDKLNLSSVCRVNAYGDGFSVLLSDYLFFGNIIEDRSREVSSMKKKVLEVNKKFRGISKEYKEEKSNLLKREIECDYRKCLNNKIEELIMEAKEKCKDSSLEKKLLKRKSTSTTNTTTSTDQKRKNEKVLTLSEMQTCLPKLETDYSQDEEINSFQLYSEEPPSRVTLMEYLKRANGFNKEYYEKEEDFFDFEKKVSETEKKGIELYGKYKTTFNERVFCTLCREIKQEDTYNQKFSKEMDRKFKVKQTDFSSFKKQNTKNTKTREQLENEKKMYLLEKENLLKSQDIFSHKYTYICHLDSVRCLEFSTTEENDIFFTAGDDYTIKMWTSYRAHLLRRQTNMYKPLHVFRGHKDKIVTLTSEEDYLFSGSLDGTIRQWEIPVDGHEHDSTSEHGQISNFLKGTIRDTKEIVWSIQKNPKEEKIVAVSSDQMLRMYDYFGDGEFEKILEIGLEKWGDPTNIKHFNSNYLADTCILGFTTGKFILYNLEKQKVVEEFNTCPDGDGKNYDHLLYEVLPFSGDKFSGLVGCCSEDKTVKLYDLKSKNLIKEFYHEHSVTSLSQNLFHDSFASGDHGCKVLSWDLKMLRILQNQSCGRQKGDEGVLCLKYHPWKNYILGAGTADGKIKIFFNNREPRYNSEERKAQKLFLREEARKKKKGKKKKGKKHKKHKKKKRRHHHNRE